MVTQAGVVSPAIPGFKAKGVGALMDHFSRAGTDALVVFQVPDKSLATYAPSVPRNLKILVYGDGPADDGHDLVEDLSYSDPVCITPPGLDELQSFLRKNARIPEERLPQVIAASRGLFLGELSGIVNEANAQGEELTAGRVLVYKTRLNTVVGMNIVSDYVVMDDVIGHAPLKEWILKRKAALVDPSWAHQRPKGLLLYGPTGTGKSTICKAIGGELGLMTIHLDMSVVMAKYVGESEERLKSILSTVESLSPCILWIDEIDKSFGASDTSGVVTRLIGLLLFWMQESKNHKVFVVASANIVKGLPPELKRPGRFDLLYYVGELSLTEIANMLFKYGGGKLNIPILKSEAYAKVLGLKVVGKHPSGAEIHQALLECIYDVQGVLENITLAMIEESIKTVVAATLRGNA